MEWSEAVAKMIKEEFDLGEGADVVIEASGAESCIQTGIYVTKKGGTYVQAGMGREVSASHQYVEAVNLTGFRTSNFRSL
jgi:threonine dehydrogenase-like Zn-dependent dehydrogenase